MSDRVFFTSSSSKNNFADSCPFKINFFFLSSSNVKFVDSDIFELTLTKLNFLGHILLFTAFKNTWHSPEI